VVRLGALSVTATLATGTGETVSVAEPFTPSLVAVIVALPAATPVTRPVELIVAAAVFELDHVTARPVSSLPLPSFTTTTACTVFPTVTLFGVMDTETDATGIIVTVTVAEPLTPSLVAVIVAVPGATLDTKPLPSTVATSLLELVQATVRPLSGLPPASRSVATACVR
jgi:hypothetical protein